MNDKRKLNYDKEYVVLDSLEKIVFPKYEDEFMQNISKFFTDPLYSKTISDLLNRVIFFTFDECIKILKELPHLGFILECNNTTYTIVTDLNDNVIKAFVVPNDLEQELSNPDNMTFTSCDIRFIKILLDKENNEHFCYYAPMWNWLFINDDELN